MIISVEPTPKPDRVHFREQQLLSAADLAAEQEHRRAARDRHYLAAHGWGVIYGLLASVGEDVLTIDPGVAVDGYGRMMVITAPFYVDMDAELTNGKNLREMLRSPNPLVAPRAVDIWLNYGEAIGWPLLRGQWPCAPGQETRVTETPWICFRDGTPGKAPPLEPLGLSPAPEQRVPDSGVPWPVFVGQVFCDPEDELHAGCTSPKGRQYPPLAGQTVFAPSRQGRLELGIPAAGGGQRFAIILNAVGGSLDQERITIDNPGDAVLTGTVRLRAGEATLLLGSTRAVGAETRRVQLLDAVNRVEASTDEPRGIRVQQRRLLAANVRVAIDASNLARRLSVAHPAARAEQQGSRRANVDLAYYRRAGRIKPMAEREATLPMADLYNEEAGASFTSVTEPGGIRFAAPLAAEPGPHPWRLYLTEVRPDSQTAGQTSSPGRQLRVEIKDPGDKGDRRRSQFVIGRRTEHGEFDPCLTVRVDGTVIVHKTNGLKVDGQVLQGPVQSDANDPRYAALLQDQAARAATVISSLTVAITFNRPPQAGQVANYDFTVTNTGADAVRSIRIWETVTFNNARSRVTQLPQALDLQPGESGTVKGSYSLVQGDTGKLAVYGTAFGITPQALQAQGFGKNEADV